MFCTKKVFTFKRYNLQVIYGAKNGSILYSIMNYGLSSIFNINFKIKHNEYLQNTNCEVSRLTLTWSDQKCSINTFSFQNFFSLLSIYVWMKPTENWKGFYNHLYFLTKQIESGNDKVQRCGSRKDTKNKGTGCHHNYRH